MLSVQNLSKHFGGVKAVDALSFEVAEREIHGLIGPNGAGKTTAINLISGILTPTSGKIILDGEEIQNLSADKRAALGIARTFQNLRLFKNLNLRRNIEVAEITARHKRTSDDNLIEDAIERFGLNPLLDQYPGSLSYGFMRRLEIVRALALRPKVIMLDEPAAGMNHEETQELFENLLWLRDRHPCAIILIEHDLKFILSASEKLTVMNMGTLLASGNAQDITKNPEVIQAYLGN